MSEFLFHLPIALLAFLILNLFVMNRATGGDGRVMVTLLAPILWIALYLLVHIPAPKKG
ncbi:MAG: hypothetical protein HZC40_04005 [Chloroflexi bacterium]|nr:hypothetical protein [Chloroflexota bacterium]